MTSIVYLSPRLLCAAPSFRLYPLLLFDGDLTTFNPSIALHEGRLYVAMRHSNMLLTANERYGFVFALKDNARDLINSTSFAALDIREDGCLACEPLPYRLPDFQDVRLFRHSGEWYGIGALAECERTAGFPIVKSVQMQLVQFDTMFRPVNATSLPSPAQAEREKNWMPFADGGGMRFVYRPAPLTIIALDPAERRMRVEFIAEGEPTAWSGSSQLVGLGDGNWLALVHRRSLMAGEFIYEHAFLRVNADFTSAISPPFHIMGVGVEFCAGLVVRENDILISFGAQNDSRAYLASVAKADVARFWEPV